MASKSMHFLIVIVILTQAAVHNVFGEVDISGLSIDHVECGYEQPYCQCREDADVCEFELELEKWLP